MINTIKTQTIKARKEHKCSWCNSIIHKNQKYTRDTLVYDGDIYDWLSCGKCQKYVNEMYQENNLDEMVTDEDLYNFCKYKYGKTPQELVEELEE